MSLDLPLPKQVFGHPWLLQGDGKMSKSKGNVIYADELVDFFGVDAVRYFVLHEMPFDNDGVITWELMVELSLIHILISREALFQEMTWTLIIRQSIRWIRRRRILRLLRSNAL